MRQKTAMNNYRILVHLQMIKIKCNFNCMPFICTSIHLPRMQCYMMNNINENFISINATNATTITLYYRSLNKMICVCLLAT